MRDDIAQQIVRLAREIVTASDKQLAGFMKFDHIDFLTDLAATVKQYRRDVTPIGIPHDGRFRFYDDTVLGGRHAVTVDTYVGGSFVPEVMVSVKVVSDDKVTDDSRHFEVNRSSVGDIAIYIGSVIDA
jgi:hypothetical protein